jgi:hypothetical protein
MARMEDRRVLSAGEIRPHCGGRGVIAGKLVIGWQGDPVEFGRRLHWAALRGGLGRARHKLVAGDGAPWIGNVAQDRWQGAAELLDFYHASEHLWSLGRALTTSKSSSAPALENGT